MELIKALLQTDLITEEQTDDIRIITINNSQYRTPKAATSRFLVYLNNRPLCSVKKLPVGGLFDIDSILYLQRKLELNEVVKAPKIHTIYYGKTSLFIVEEYIEGSNLVEIMGSQRNPDKSIQLVKSIMTELIKISSDNSVSTFDNETSQIKNRVTAIKNYNAGIVCFLEQLEVIEEVIKSPTVLSNGDLIAQNIILTDDGPFLVDYDLTTYTEMFWANAIRFVYYARMSEMQLELPLHSFSEFLPDSVDTKFLELIVIAKEMILQEKIHDIGHNLIVQKELEQDFINKCNQLFNIKAPVFIADEQEIEGSGKYNRDYIQIYWNEDVNQEFSEQRSMSSEINDEKEIIFTFDLTNQINSLRIDPIKAPGLIKVLSIIAHDCNGYAYSLLDNVLFEVGKNDLILHDDETLTIISFSDDPQILFNKLPFNTIQNLQVNLIVSSDINSIKQEILALKLESNSLHLNIENLNHEYEMQRNELLMEIQSAKQLVNERVEEIKKYKQQIDFYMNSRSWKLTEPLRVMGRNIKKLLSIIKKCIKKGLGEKGISLITSNDIIISDDGNWESIGNDPYFIIQPVSRSGLMELSYIGAASSNTPLVLYYDVGQGMNEQQIIAAGYLDNDVKQHATIIAIPRNIITLRLDVGEQPQRFALKNIRIRPIPRIERTIRPIYTFIVNHGFSVSTIKLVLSKIIRLYKYEGIKGIINKNNSLLQKNTQLDTQLNHYQEYLRMEAKTDKEWKDLEHKSMFLRYRPLLSILVPVYNVDEEWIRKCVHSVQRQIYSNWELCLVDDCSTKPHIKQVLNELEASDARIRVKYRNENGHISLTSNDALEMADGEFVGLLDHDDELTPDALFENVKLLNQYPDADVIYSDEDKISVKGERHSPYFKPDWSPDTLMSQMYTCHFTLYRKSLVYDAGKFRTGYEGSQDYDLMLRVAELTDNIHHIPKILYHWRAIPNSTATSANVKNYAHVAGIKALEDTLIRRNIDGWVEEVEDISNLYRVHYRPTDTPKISIIIPSKNMAEVLGACLNSIFKLSIYSNFEIIVVDNGSSEPATHELYELWKLREPNRFFVHPLNIPFNYSKLNNYGVTKSTGELLLLLNNDVSIISPTWLEEMAGQAVRPEIGAVGASLLYPDNTLQHAGVVLGIGGVAGHSHKYFPSSSYGYFSRLKMVSNYSAVTAACLMIKKDIYNNVGGFEENLQVAFNDVDFCLKVREKGFYNVWLPQVQLYHYESKSRGHEDTPEKQKRFKSEIEWMRNRWAEVLDNDPCYNPNLTKEREDFSIRI